MPADEEALDIFNIWLAGFFDGEGCITVQNPYKSLRITIAQAHKPILVRVQRRFGGNLSHNGKCNVWTLALESISDMKSFLTALEPYLILKRNEALVAIEIYNTAVGSGKSHEVTNQDKLYRVMLFDKLHDLAEVRREAFRDLEAPDE